MKVIKYNGWETVKFYEFETFGLDNETDLQVLISSDWITVCNLDRIFFMTTSKVFVSCCILSYLICNQNVTICL